MSSSSLVRSCGLAIVASSVLFVVSILLVANAGSDQHDYAVLVGLSNLIDMIAGPLEILGLVGLYARRPQTMGVFGLIAFVVAFFGGVLQAGTYWYNALVVPSLASINFQLLAYLNSENPGFYAFGNAFTSSLYMLGWLLFGVAILRARLYPRLAAVLLLVVSALLIVDGLAGSIMGLSYHQTVPVYATAGVSILQNVIFAWLGFALWTGWGASEAPPGAPAEFRPLS